MTQDATTTKTIPSRPSISRLVYHYDGTPVVQMGTTPASISVNSANTDNDDPVPYSVINLPTLFPASGITTKLGLIFNRLPALSWSFSSLSCVPRRHLFLAMFLYTVLLVLVKRARARILDRWQGYRYTHLKSMGWKKCGASDNTVKRATLFIQYQDAQSNHCYTLREALEF